MGARMRRNERADVVATHLRLLRARIAELEGTAGGDAGRLREARLAEEGLGRLLPAVWGIGTDSRRPAAEQVEARVLIEVRAAAAVLALAAQQPAAAGEGGRADPAIPTALFRYASEESERFDPALLEPVVPRRGVLGVVLDKHLRLLGERRADLGQILGGRASILVPTLTEQSRFEQELRETERAEQALGTVLPALWDVPPRPGPAPRLVAEARALVRIRAAAATLALTLQQATTPPSDADERIAQLVALFRYVQRALVRFEFDDGDDLPGKSAQYDRMIAYAIFGQRWGSF